MGGLESKEASRGAHGSKHSGAWHRPAGVSPHSVNAHFFRAFVELKWDVVLVMASAG
jgi:hypothetical protein